MEARGRYSATVVKVWKQAIRMSYTGCATKTSPGKHQKGSSTPVSQSGQKKTRAMVAQSCENDEEALMCLERTSSKRTLKKSGTDGSTNSGVGKLNGRPAKII